jgi:hypothetical protein
MKRESKMAKEKEEKKSEKVQVLNRGQRVFTVAKGVNVPPGESEVARVHAEKLRKDYPREIRILGEK